MMSYCRAGFKGIRVMLGVSLLGAFLLSAPDIQAAPQYALDCSSCHTMPPTDSGDGSRNPDSGAFKGNHQTHAVADPVSCTKCHGAAVLTATGHRDKIIQVNGNINNSPAAASYSRGFFNQTSVPPASLGTCSSVNCHFEKITPAWGSAPLGAPGLGTCATCHDALPTTYAHTTHIEKYGNDLTACTQCHPGHTTFQHATSAGNTGRTIAVTSGTYTGSNFKYLPSESATRTVGTCSTATCHGSVYGSGTITTPSWSSTSNGCSACHTVAIGASGPATGSHALSGHNTACTACHAAGTAQGSIPSSGHADGDIDILNVGYPANVAKHASGSGYSTCSTASCHANVYGSGTITTPTWGSTGNGCSACHTVAIGASGPATGTHTAHMALGGAACTQCHASGTTDTTVPGSSHVDGDIDVTNGYPATAKHAAGTYTGSCSTASCHGSRSPVWGANTANASCTKCHGKGTVLANYSTTNAWQAAPGYAGTGVDIAGQTGTVTNGVSSDPQVGAHDAHLRAINGYTNRRVLCTDCHAIPGSILHANGSTNFAWSDLARNVGTTPYNGDKGAIIPSYSGGSCSTVYCHGGGFAAAVQGTGATVAWNNTTYLANPGSSMNATDCNQCHQSPPTASVKYNHNGISIGAGSCSACHNHDGYGDARHINGILEATGGACNACHAYDTVNGAWGTGSHKDGAVAEGWGAHAKHIEHLKTVAGVALNADTDTYGSAAFNAICGVCHTQDVANHTMNNSSQRLINFHGATTYKTGSLNPLYNGVSGTSSSVNPKTCSNISCHFNDSPRWQ